MPIEHGSALATLVDLVDLVRDYARAEALDFYSRTWTTLDGRVTIDYVPECMVRVTFSGDAPTRSYVLAHDWPA